MMMKNPPHPGEVIRELCLRPLNLSVTDAAQVLGVSRKALSELLNGHSGVSPEMALRLSAMFDTTPESWLTQQMQYDLWQEKEKEEYSRLLSRVRKAKLIVLPAVSARRKARRERRRMRRGQVYTYALTGEISKGTKAKPKRQRHDE